MKVALLILACLAVASCAIYPYDVSGNCDFKLCRGSGWRANNTSYSYRCPVIGFNKASFRQNDSTKKLFLDFTAQSSYSTGQDVSIPLIFNPSYEQSGLQYYQTFNYGDQFSIFNCSISYSKEISPLCSYHSFVAGKYLNGVFLSECAFALNYVNYHGLLSDQ